MELICTRCNRRFTNAGGLARHVKTQHSKPAVESSSLLRYIKRAPKKKVAIELKPLKKKAKQVKFKAKRRVKAVLSGDSPVDAMVEEAPGPPRRPRSRQSDQDLTNFRAPASLTTQDLDKKSPEFRAAHVRYFRRLREDLFPMMDKTAYHAANADVLGVKLRRFHQWFDSHDADLKKIKENKKPKPEKPREQNKVVTQGSRKKWTPKQKLDFIREYDRLREEDSSLTQKQFCDSRSHSNMIS